MTSIGNLQVGDRVKSRWSPRGTVWEVQEVVGDSHVWITSVSSGRRDLRQIDQLQLA